MPVVSCPTDGDVVPTDGDVVEEYVSGGADDTGRAAVDDAGTGVGAAVVDIGALVTVDALVVACALAFLFISRFITHRHTRSLALARPKAVASVSALAGKGKEVDV